MTTLQTDSVPSPEEELIETRAPSSAPSSSNRVIVSLAVIGVVGLVLIALAQTVGQDLLVHARRWSRVRKAAPPALSESTATADAAAGDSVAFRQLRHVSNSNAADAQISPPRRKTTPTSGPAAAPTPVDAAGQATVEPLANDPNRQAAIAANAIDLPVGLPTGIDIPTGPAMNGAPHVPATDPTEELLDTAAQLVSLSWQDFEYPVRWLAAETSKPRMI